MSKIYRDLARESALRAKYRRDGHPNPKCEGCGEANIRRLAFKKGRPPICRNCLADRQYDPACEAEMRERFRRAGFPEPQCVACGETRIWRLELDHVAGQKHDATCSPLCCNCHAERTFMQNLEPPGGENPQNVLEVIGRWLLGIAEWFELIGQKLYQFGEFLIGLAKQGYGGEFSFPQHD
jgi:hypothetical protein